MKRLKAPFPYFGGKSTVAPTVWQYLGDCDNYIEPFFGSGAVLLARPHPPRIETVNDADCYLANFWRATQHDPEAVAEYADGPVNEADLHSRHRWLVLSEEAAAFRQQMRTDPNYYDPKIAGWWCWGLCCWIGSGWCNAGVDWQQTPAGQRPLTGVHGEVVLSQQIPLIGDPPRGVHGAGLDNRMPANQNSNGLGRGVHAKGTQQQRQCLEYRGIHAAIQGGNRPQLADAYSRGRGVHGNDDMGTCDQRRAWLLDWFYRLRDRFRTVRVCCGDWLRVCDSESVTTRLGLTGIFFDPPYGHGAERNDKLYSVDSLSVAQDVRRYCLERGSNPQMRMVLAGYAGEGHEELESNGWEVVEWKSQGGYGNRTNKGKANAKKERLWLSPHCIIESVSLFSE